MKNSNLLKGEKIYLLETVDQDGHHEIYEIAAFSLKEAKKIKSEIIGNSKDGEKAVGRLRLKNKQPQGPEKLKSPGTNF